MKLVVAAVLALTVAGCIGAKVSCRAYPVWGNGGEQPEPGWRGVGR